MMTFSEVNFTNAVVDMLKENFKLQKEMAIKKAQIIKLKELTNKKGKLQFKKMEWLKPLKNNKREFTNNQIMFFILSIEK